MQPCAGERERGRERERDPAAWRWTAQTHRAHTTQHTQRSTHKAAHISAHYAQRTHSDTQQHTAHSTPQKRRTLTLTQLATHTHTHTHTHGTTLSLLLPLSLHHAPFTPIQSIQHVIEEGASDNCLKPHNKQYTAIIVLFVQRFYCFYSNAIAIVSK